MNYAYTYETSDWGADYTTTKIECETIGDTTYKYTYDEYGNITEIFRVNADSTPTILYSYSYDQYNQLSSVTDGITNTYTIYSYDESGNILNITTKNWNGDDNTPDNGTIISSINYLYNDSEWKDLLTSYNGQTITYDSIGNPLNYRDDITLTWQNGRELATYSDANNNITYTYDIDGMRTGKSVTNSAGTSTSYTYVYENGQLLQMCMGSRIYDFSYDANGTPVSVAYRTRATATPTYYYYAVNSRGDITALYNGSGSIVAVYEYDAYGKLISVENATGVAITSATHIANMNPLRYRGYVYDNETGFYYLQSRYYDPTTCRFINADNRISGVGGEILGYNAFSYCMNNPVVRYDPTGEWMELLFGVVTYPISLVFNAMKNDYNASSKSADTKAVDKLLEGKKTTDGNIRIPKDSNGILYNKSNREYASKVIKEELGPNTNRTEEDISAEIYAHVFGADVFSFLANFNNILPSKYNIYERFSVIDVNEDEGYIELFVFVEEVFEWEE